MNAVKKYTSTSKLPFGIRCWSTEIILTPSIMPLITFSSFFSKEINFVPEGNRDSLVFTKDVIGTPSMLPGIQGLNVNYVTLLQIQLVPLTWRFPLTFQSLVNIFLAITVWILVFKTTWGTMERTSLPFYVATLRWPACSTRLISMPFAYLIVPDTFCLI